MDTLTGSVERIIFYNPENGYTVLRLRPEHQTGMHATPKSSLSFDYLATVVGNLPEVSPGEHLRVQCNGTNIQNTVHNLRLRCANKLCKR